jgi:hypothetical protein
MSEISDRIEGLLAETGSAGELYLTVRAISKKLGIKQQEVIDNLPPSAVSSASHSGALGEYRISLVEDQEEEEDEYGVNVGEGEDEEWDPNSDEEDEMSEEVEVVDNPEETQEVDAVEETPAAETPAAEVPAEEEREVCIVCDSKVRSTTETVRGMCPLCLRQFVKNSGLSMKAILALSLEEFDAAVTAERASRGNLAEYKTSRILTKEEFESMKDTLIPVKELFAAAKAAGYGQGRVAQAVGGDKFRHEPVGGFGSVWTPYFYGPRVAWYFDRDILNHFDDLKKAPKVVKEKKARKTKTDSNGNPISRSGPRGAALRPVPSTEAPSVST